jgi:hypothetical protein
VAGTIGAEPRNGSHVAPAAHTGGEGVVPSATLRVVRAIGDTRTWLERRQAVPAPAPRPQLSTREWLARAAFSLLAVTVVLAIVLTALSLLDGAETAGLLMPVVALAAIVVGFYLGSEAAGERASNRGGSQ